MSATVMEKRRGVVGFAVGAALVLSPTLVVLAACGDAASAVDAGADATVTKTDADTMGTTPDARVASRADAVSATSDELVTEPDIQVALQSSCALTSGGEVVCWGLIPAPKGAFARISAREGHGCGVLRDGSLRCWGADIAGETQVPGGEFREVAAGGAHSCAITWAGNVACWGAGKAMASGLFDWGQSEAPRGLFTHVAAGVFHSCAIRDVGADGGPVECWGDDFEGQSSPPDRAFVELAAGEAHTCGIDDQGRVRCWGGGQADEPLPGERFVNIAAGDETTCGITAKRELRCWEPTWATDDDAGTADTGTDDDAGGPTTSSLLEAPTGTFRRVAVGANHACAIRSDDRVVCWGRNEAGETEPPADLRLR